MRRFGRDVADGTIVGLYRDVRTLHTDIGRYDPDSVFGWLRKLEAEIDAYVGRMTSMRDAAVGAETFERLVRKLGAMSLSVSRAEPLIQPGLQRPVGWTLIAAKA